MIKIGNSIRDKKTDRKGEVVSVTKVYVMAMDEQGTFRIPLARAVRPRTAFRWKRTKQKERDLLDVKLCNCAGCGCEMFSQSMTAKQIESAEKRSGTRRPRMAGRVFDRPYCVQCVDEQVKREGVF